MTWNDIPGWFRWQEYTDHVVKNAPAGAVLVEIGVFCGRSLAYLATRAKEANKGLKVVGIDTFAGSPEFFDGGVLFNGKSLADMPKTTLVSAAYEFLTNAGVINDVTLLVSDSAKAAELFADGSVHSVFLDGDHTEAGVTADIHAWLPKVENGGWMGGDDYEDTFPGVKAAVDATFLGATLAPIGRPWWAVHILGIRRLDDE